MYRLMRETTRTTITTTIGGAFFDDEEAEVHRYSIVINGIDPVHVCRVDYALTPQQEKELDAVVQTILVGEGIPLELVNAVERVAKKVSDCIMLTKPLT